MHSHLTRTWHFVSPAVMCLDFFIKALQIPFQIIHNKPSQKNTYKAISCFSIAYLVQHENIMFSVYIPQ